MSRRNKKKIKDARLAVQPNQRNIDSAPKKAEMLKNGEDVEHIRGRKSYAQIAIDQGLYELIEASIGDYSVKHPEASFKKLFEFIQPLYPSVFNEDMSKYPSNFQQIIEKDDGWRKAWYGRRAATTKQLFESRIFKIVTDKNTDDKTIINAYDKYMKYNGTESEKDKLELETLRMKNKLIEAQIEKLKSNQIEDPYINSFLQNLSQIGGD